MFTIAEIKEVTVNPAFIADYTAVRQTLVNQRLNQPLLLGSAAVTPLLAFVEAVIASAPDWDVRERAKLCEIGAEIAEAIAATEPHSQRGRTMRLRAALLYELAGMPSLASTVIHGDDLTPFLSAFIQRRDAFEHLNGFRDAELHPRTPPQGLAYAALTDDAVKFVTEAQSEAPLSPDRDSQENWTSEPVSRLAQTLSLELNASTLRAYATVVSDRMRRATNLSIESRLIPAL